MAENTHEKIREGNDIGIRWSLIDENEQPYIFDGRNVSVEIDIAGKKRYRVKELTHEGNTLIFTYWGKDQKYSGLCSLKFIENDGEKEMVTFDIPNAFELVPHSWLTGSAPENERVQLSFVTLTSTLTERIGPVGPAAGFGEIKATIDELVGTPSVEVITSGPDTAKNITFVFSNLKGEPGQDASVTAENIKAALGYTPADEDNVNAALASKQDTLESGTNIKTFAGESLLGSGKFGRVVEIMWGGGGSSSREALYVQIDGGAVFLVSHGNNAALVIIKHPSDFDFIPLTKGSKWVVGMPPYSPQTGRRVCFYDWTNNEQGVSGEYWFYPIHFPGTPATKAITIGKTAANSFTDDQSHVIEYYTKPTSGIPASDIAAGVIPDVSGKVDKVPNAITGNIAIFDENGNIMDDGFDPGQFATLDDLGEKMPRIDDGVEGHLVSIDNSGNGTDSGIAASEIVTRTVNNLANYYLKTETYTKAEVATQIANALKGSFVSVSVLPTASADTMGKIYLVPSQSPEPANIKDEFITEERNGSYVWEQIGTTAIDLSDYVTTEDLDGALNNLPFAEGFGTDSAEQWNCEAEGNYSMAEGYNTTAKGQASHAEGAGTIAQGAQSHAEGSFTETTNDGEHAEGQFNKSNTGNDASGKTAHSIGVGSSLNARKNAFEVMQNGDAYLLGIGGYDGTNPAQANTLKQVIDGKGNYTKPVAGIPKTDLADDVKTSLSKADSTDERMTASQTKIAWLDPFIWTGEQVWPKKEGGGSVDVDVKQLLRSAPSLIVRGDNHDDKVIYVSHPLSDYPGAEIVLMHYAKKSVKLDGPSRHRRPKKGYCVAVGGTGGEAHYFTFGAETSYDALYDYCDGYFVPAPTGHFGIALRIPNPEWTRDATMHKNATYKGIPESLWSDVLRIGLSYDEENNTWGLGIK